MTKPLALAVMLALAVPMASEAGERGAKVSRGVVEKAARAESVDVLIWLATPSPLASPASTPRVIDRDARLRGHYDHAQRASRTAAAGVVAALSRAGVPHRRYEHVPVVVATVPSALIQVLAARADVRAIVDDPVVRGIPEAPVVARKRTEGGSVAGGVMQVGATTLWARGLRGEGIVVAGADTGVMWSHDALAGNYRGAPQQGQPVTHDYHWHDAIVEPLVNGGNSCGYANYVPCDDNGHGTHTIGTMVATQTGYTAGVAPGAKWIACRNMERGWGKPSTYLDCFEWFLAPTNGSGTSPDPTKAPHVINNSWTCPAAEGCGDAERALLEASVESLVAAGIVVVGAAGNVSSGGIDAACYTIASPPASLDAQITVASSEGGGRISTFSARGPVISDGSGRLKPDITAPGENVISSVPPFGFGASSGTSMAAPHVAGAAALLMQGVPALRGDPAAVRAALLGNAQPRVATQDCGAFAGNAVPNAVYGHGFLDVVAAYDDASVERVFRNGFE